MGVAVTVRGKRWAAVFLGTTALAVGEELYGAFGGNPDFLPWTQLIVRYVPWPITAAGILVLIVWLPRHFYRAYRRSGK